MNLLSIAEEALGHDFATLAGRYLGESAEATRSALAALLPAVIGAIAQKGATSAAASGLMALIDGAALDNAALFDPAGLFTGAGAYDLIEAGSGSLLPALFGHRTQALARTVSAVSGVKHVSATDLLAIVAPLTLTLLKRLIGKRGWNASALSALLCHQAPVVHGAIDPRVAVALGFAPAHADAGLAREPWLWRCTPWLLGFVALVLLYNLVGGRPPALAPAPAREGTVRLFSDAGPRPEVVVPGMRTRNPR